MRSTKVDIFVQKAIAILLIIEGVYYLAGIIATIIIKHLLFLDLRCLLILLGIHLWTNKHYSQGMAIAYYLFALINTIFFKADTWFLIPDTANIFYVFGFISLMQYSEQTLSLIITAFAIIRVTQVLLLLFLLRFKQKV